MADFHSQATDNLMEAILSLKNKKECYAFFEDICTIKEILEMAQRLEAAKMLEDGMNYQKITERLGISTATISRVSRCMNYGSGGYRKVLANLKKKESEGK